VSSGYKDYIRDTEAEILAVLKDNPKLNSEDLIIEDNTITIKKNLGKNKETETNFFQQTVSKKNPKITTWSKI